MTVMTLPWYIIRKIQISTAKKVGIGAVFSVVLIIIACDILRTVKSFDQGAFSDSALYSFLEVTLAVIVSCLPIYRALFRASKKGGASKNAGGAFIPISQQRTLIATNAPIPSPDERRQATRARRSWRPSSKLFQNKRRNTEPKSDKQHLTPLRLQELPSVHLGSVGRSSVDASSLV